MTNRPYAEWDTECAPNYWLIKFRTPMSTMHSFTLLDDKPMFAPAELQHIGLLVKNFTLVGFNSDNYDLPMFKYALTGCGVRALKALNDHIIVGGLKRWDVRKHYPQAEIPELDHVDIMEVAPGVQIGLKTYMARMHSKTIQDLPFDPAEELTPEKQAITDAYCGNDLIGTKELREEVGSRLALRERLTVKYGTDLRSKSDAQMSEAIIAAQLGYRPERKFIPEGTLLTFRPAPWLTFASEELRAVLATCAATPFRWSNKEKGETILDADGSKVKTGVNMPKEIASIRIRRGSGTYKFGMGGLHSQESAQTIYSSPRGKLYDRDVSSYYPSLVILLGLLSPEIMAIYTDIYWQRVGSKPRLAELSKLADLGDIAAKAQHGELATLVDGFKIVMNGFYGKLWSGYSFALNPEAAIAITLNGQLSFLMLIEMLELGGVRVVSMNTDGLICFVPPALEGFYRSTFEWWEKATGLVTEETPYRSIHMRDVNNYVAVTTDGKQKRKGVFSKSGVVASMQGIHPDRDIAKEAAIKYMVEGVPVETTVRACRDIRMFVLSRKVGNGGGVWREGYLGSTVRWYYGTNGAPILSRLKGSKVAGSDGAVPIQTLPDEFPHDLDYVAYENFARELVADAGFNTPTVL